MLFFQLQFLIEPKQTEKNRTERYPAYIKDMPSATTKEWEGFGCESKIMSIDQAELEKAIAY